MGQNQDKAAPKAGAEKKQKLKMTEIPEGGLRDARQLGAGKMLVLGVQHMFAMFGATVLVPALTGLSVSSTLLFAGLGTLLFHLLTKRKVPAFLGSSFAFIAGYQMIAPNGEKDLLPYACLGVACAGLVYLVLSALIRVCGTQRVMRFFPPIVTGPVIIAIGITLANSAINSCTNTPDNPNSIWYALIAIAVVIVCNIWGKGMVKIIPVVLGILVSYIAAAVTGGVNFQPVIDADWIGLPFQMNDTVFSIFGEGANTSLMITSIVAIVPIALATMVEHIGDICAISSTTGENYIENPGLHRTMLGDGLATVMASLFGAPANTTYGENTGVLTLTKVYDPRVIRIAAAFAVLFSFSPKFAAIIETIPVGTMGGVSLVLYGMIAAVGVRNVVENKVDFTKSRNVIIAALILVLSIGIKFSNAGAVSFTVGSVTIALSGLAVAAIVGIVLNAVLPGKDYEFGKDEKGDQSVNFEV